MHNFKNYITISLLFVVVLVVNNVFASGEGIAVLYPDIREPYRSVFTNIIDGVKDTIGNDVHTLAIKKGETSANISDWLKKHKIEGIIALGSRSQKLVAKSTVQNKIVGAITNPRKDNAFNAGVLLTPNPHKVFEKLNSLVPGIKYIYAVYSEENSGWYIELAKKAAESQGIDLVAIKSESKKESLLHYKSILDNKINKESAVWLLQDPLSSDSKLILPMVLAEAWDKKIPVISNKAGYVERGALLALYPDHFELGISLSNMLLDNTNNDQIYLPFSKALYAVNTRTADHLDLGWTRKTKRSIDLVFPK
jgi:putative tryptophan/tyrosine transport system substrate-binding protein